MSVQCEHRADGVRCRNEANFAIHDQLAMCLWACDEHVAPLLREASARLNTLFVKVEVYKVFAVPVRESVPWEMIA